MRPFTPNVRGEEVSSNYEPVLITNRGFAVSPVPPTPNPTPSTLKVKAKTFIFLVKTSNPFNYIFPVPTEGLGLNPILQDPAELRTHPF